MAKVIVPFRDRHTWVAYRIGDDYDGTPERLQRLSEGGFVQYGVNTHSDGENASGGNLGIAESNLDALTVAELRTLCAERGIAAPSRATKAHLLELLGA
jgi:hypothetical protein